MNTQKCDDTLRCLGSHLITERKQEERSYGEVLAERKQSERI